MADHHEEMQLCTLAVRQAVWDLGAAREKPSGCIQEDTLPLYPLKPWGLNASHLAGSAHLVGCLAMCYVQCKWEWHDICSVGCQSEGSRGADMY